jgi:pimeloyl-ACP methyl ester carboxylesterase
MGTEPDTWSDLPQAIRDERMATFKDARLVEVPGAGHYVHLEQPDFVLDEIAAFLAEIGA